MALMTMISGIKDLPSENDLLIALLVIFAFSALLAGLISFCIKKESLECLVIPISILFIWVYAAFNLSLIAIVISLIVIERNIRGKTIPKKIIRDKTFNKRGDK